MDKDRIKGSAEQAKGAVKESAGKIFGDGHPNSSASLVVGHSFSRYG
jgi:hypothetical protein